MLAVLTLLAVFQPNIEVGQNLTPPAQVAGPWEGLVAPGEVAGFSLQVTTNANETVRSLRLDTYVRTNGKTLSTWWSSGDAGEFVMRTGRLHFRQARSKSTRVNVSLDLSFDPVDMTWKGSFADPFFAGQVTLRRPTLSDAVLPLGTWRTNSSLTLWPSQRVQNFGCLNIGLGQDDALVLWRESYSVFLGHAKGEQPSFGDVYGEQYADSPAERYGGELSFTAGTNLGGDRLTGTLSTDGSSFGGYSEHYGNGLSDPAHPRHTFAWTRMLNLACRP